MKINGEEEDILNLEAALTRREIQRSLRVESLIFFTIFKIELNQILLIHRLL